LSTGRLPITLGAQTPLRQTIRRSRRLCARGCRARFFPSLPTSITATSSFARPTTSILTAPTSSPTTHPSCDSSDCDGQRAPFYALWQERASVPGRLLWWWWCGGHQPLARRPHIGV